jgi:hypothetical protein
VYILASLIRRNIIHDTAFVGKIHLEIHNQAGLLDCIKEHASDRVIMGQTPVELYLVSQSFMKTPLVIIALLNHALT